MAHPDNIAAIANSTAHLTEDADDITYMDIAYSSYIMKNLASMEQISEEVSVFLLSRNNASFQEIYSSPWPMVFTVISAHIVFFVCALWQPNLDWSIKVLIFCKLGRINHHQSAQDIL